MCRGYARGQHIQVSAQCKNFSSEAQTKLRCNPISLGAAGFEDLTRPPSESSYEVLSTLATDGPWHRTYHAASYCDLILGRVNRSPVSSPHAQTISTLCMPKLSSDSSPSTESFDSRAGVEYSRAILVINTSRQQPWARDARHPSEKCKANRLAECICRVRPAMTTPTIRNAQDFNRSARNI